MGLYDRDYYREERRYALSFGTPRPAVVAIIVINVLVALVDAFTPAARLNEGRWLSDALAVHAGGGAWPDTLRHPWMWWQLLTSGFAHSPGHLSHLVGNMLCLWFFAGDIEELYGRRRFVALYLGMVVLGALVWAAGAQLFRVVDLGGRVVVAPSQVYGASGAVTGTIVLYALNFPRRTVLFMFLIPVRAWVLGVLAVGLDVLGLTGWTKGTNVAYSIHLTGAAVALLYHFQGAALGRLLVPLESWLSRLRRRPRLRVYEEEQPPPPEERDLAAEVDRILEKIYRLGEASLTRKERRTLEEASREFQRRRRD